MEKRSSQRLLIGLKAEILYGGKSYSGAIENLSSNGLNIITFSTSSKVEFKSGSIFKLKFQSISGELLNLNCNVRWSSQISPNGLTNRVGVEISAPPM